MQASKNFAVNLRREMQERGLSQRALAEMVGITFTYVNRILLEKQNPSIDICDRIADSLQLELSELLTNPKKLTKSA